MTTPPAGSCTVRELHDDDEPAVLALLQQSLSGGPTGERTAAFLRWKHRDNPFGPSAGLVAVGPDGDLAAVRLLLRWQLSAHGRTVRAVRAVDTATAPAYRGQGLFRRLTLEALSGVAADADLVFNTPNAQSLPGYLSMGWHEVAVLPVRLRPVRPVRFLRGVRSAGQAPVDAPPPPVASSLPPAGEVLRARADEVAALLEQVEAGADPGTLRTPRTARYVHWRYAGAPGLDYRAVVVEGRGGLRALGLGRLRYRGPLVELTLGEVLHAPDDRRGADAVLRSATRSGVDHVALHLPASSALARRATARGYVPAPGRGLRLVTRVQRPVDPDPRQAASWSLALGDLEVF